MPASVPASVPDSGALTRPRHGPLRRLGTLAASAVRAGPSGPADRHRPSPAAVGPGEAEPGTATEVVRTGPADDASHLGPEPGSYEWWNFFATDGEVAVSAIFMPANLFDTRYRRAVHALHAGPGPAPDPRDFPLLQVNVAHRGTKKFTTVRNPPGTTTEFSTTTAHGRIGASTFAGEAGPGTVSYRVHLDVPTMTNLGRLHADLVLSSPGGGVAVAEGGLYGPIPGGSAHQWQLPLALPEVHGEVSVRNRRGHTTFHHVLDGTGYTDHCWGAGLLGEVLGAWTFGRADLGDAGAAIVVWFEPRDATVAPYGRVLRLRPATAGPPAELHPITARRVEGPWRGALGLAYWGDQSFSLDGGSLRVRFPRRLGEDWPFQVSGEGHFDVHLPGEDPLLDVPGPVEHLRHAAVDDPFFVLLDGLVPRLPWFS